MSAPGVIALATDAESAEWDEFVRSRPDGTGYHLWAWRAVFARGLRLRSHYLTIREDGRIVGLLPLVEVRSWLFGRALSSLPYVNYGGVLAETDDAADALVAEAARLATRQRLSYVLLRHRQRRFPALPARDHKVTLVLPLAASDDAMWNALDRKVRNQVRKAEKSGVTTLSGGAELLDEFYGVFARNMRDLGTPVYGRALFAAMLETFPGDVRVHLARLGSQTIAGAISYAYGDTIEVPSASSLREHRALCPNHLLYWAMVREGIAQGRRRFDFGRSTPGDGTYHFKTQWGGVPEQLWWEYRLSPGAAVPSDDRHSRKFRATIEMWKRLPLAAASMLGPRLARVVP
jgi:FemAB-related protein (PEP-CTERM system-associated)